MYSDATKYNTDAAAAAFTAKMNAKMTAADLTMLHEMTSEQVHEIKICAMAYEKVMATIIGMATSNDPQADALLGVVHCVKLVDEMGETLELLKYNMLKWAEVKIPNQS